MTAFKELPLKTRVIVHINYRDIFNFPVHEDELTKWLIQSTSNHNSELDHVLQELVEERLLTCDRGYYSVFGKQSIIDERIEKKKFNRKIIEECQHLIKFFMKIPYIKYMGISGSIAAENPTLDKIGSKKGTVDFDIFLITKTNTLWISYFIIKSLNVIVNLFSISKHYLCFNYAMDESYLEIHNRSFYTATELYNLKSISGEPNANLMSANSWAMNYYPLNNSGKDKPLISKPNFIIRGINFLLFATFQFFRCFKRVSLSPLLEIHKKFNNGQRHNIHRVCPPNGGYQDLIKQKFIRNFKSSFSDYYSDHIANNLFPHKLTEKKETRSEIHYDREMQENFARYS